MIQFYFTETTYDIENKKIVDIVKWTVVPTGLHNNNIIVWKTTPTTKRGDIKLKVFNVEDTDEYIFKALKTKIKAKDGAEGLVKWMIKNKDLFECRIKQLLNYAWDEIKYYYL